MRALWLCALLLAMVLPVRADETVRQVQEQLRKRNLFFGDVDGRITPELTGALKRYQSRKGFEVTGTVDGETAASLHITTTVALSKPQESWPEVPVLKSDVAREVPEQQRVALEAKAEQNPDLESGPPPPAESPAQPQNLTPERVSKFVEDYLRDGETQDVAAQMKYYAFPIDYFDHGTVDERFVEKDNNKYVKRWPERKYMLTAPVQFLASGKEGETIVEFPIAFSVRNKKHAASGRTKNFWTIRAEGDELKIVAIREQRLRE